MNAVPTATVPDAMLLQTLRELVNTHSKNVVQEALKQVLSEVDAAAAPASEAGTAAAPEAAPAV